MAALGGGLFLAFLVVPLAVDRLVHSLRFEEFLAQRAGGVFSAEARLDPLRWSGASAHSGSLTLHGHEESPIEKIQASGLRADWNWRALFAGTWRIEQITVDLLSASFKEQQSVRPPPSETKEQAAPGFSWLPSRLELGKVVVHRANIRYKEFTANNVSIKATRQGDTWVLEGTGGMLEGPLLPPLTISTFRLRVRDGVLLLDDSSFGLAEGGSLRATGQSGRDATLHAEWNGVAAGAVFGPDWGPYIAGTLTGESTHSSLGRARGEFHLANGALRNIPLMNEVATLTGNPAFRQPVLETLRADFDYDKGTTTLTNLVAESKGLARLEGSLTISPGGGLDGRFQLGLSGETLRHLPGTREALFTSERDGWFWTPMILGGTFANPIENLSARLAPALAGRRLLDVGSEAIK
jgi:hypothetical protein